MTSTIGILIYLSCHAQVKNDTIVYFSKKEKRQDTVIIEMPENIILPFYEKDLIIPFHITQEETKKIMGSEPGYVDKSVVLYKKDISLNGEKYPTTIGFEYKNNQLINASIGFKESVDKESYEKSFKDIYKIITNELGEFDNFYWFNVGKSNSMPEVGFDAIMGESNSSFEYYWDKNNLTYMFCGSRMEDNDEKYVFMYIFIRSFIPRYVNDYTFIEK